MTTNQTLGQRIATLRRQRGLTQDQLAEQLGISPQAVSKWENDVSCPDIMLLPALADLLQVTADVLLRGEAQPETRLIPEETRKAADKLILRLRIFGSNGDKIQVNLPFALLRAGLLTNMTFEKAGHPDMFSIKSADNNGHNPFQAIDPEQIIALVDQGVLGKLVEATTADGDQIEVWVE